MDNVCNDRIYKSFSTGIYEDAKWESICYLVQKLYDLDAVNNSSEELDKFLDRLRRGHVKADNDL